MSRINDAAAIVAARELTSVFNGATVESFVTRHLWQPRKVLLHCSGSLIAICAIANVGATKAQAAFPTSVVSTCAGVSLPRSVVTDIVRPPLNNIVTPLQGTVNNILGVVGIIPLVGQIFPTLNIDVNGLLNTAASGAPIGLSVLDNNGTIIGPLDQCNSISDSLQLNTQGGISIGGNRITGLGLNGLDAVAGESGSIAFGNNALTSVGAVNSTAIGSGARATAANGVAIGAGSLVDRTANPAYAAIGITGTTSSAGAVSVGATGAERQITNVAAGLLGTDAANVAQLSGALDDLAAAAPIQYSTLGLPTTPNIGITSDDVTLVGLTPGAPVSLHNVAAGSLAAGSTDAVNGAQLFATNNNVVANTTAIVGNTTAITNTSSALTNLTNNVVNGTIGLVLQAGGAPGAGIISVGAATGGTVLAVAGTDGNRTLTGVAAGAVAAASVEAINGGQLFATNTQVGLNAAAIVTNTAAIAGNTANILTNTANIATNVTNIAANTASIVTNTANIAGNTTNITNLTNGVAGLVLQAGGAPGTGLISIGSATGGTAITIAGTDGVRSLSGVAAGTIALGSTQAINGAQLFATNTQVGLNAAAIVTNTTAIAGNTANILTNTTNIATNVTNIAANAADIVTNTTNIAGNTTNITNLTNGTAGLLLQVGGAPGNGLLTVGAATGGTAVNFAGTAGTRILSGISAGIASTDAVNLGQLNAVTANAANAVIYDIDGGGIRLDSVSLIGGTAGPVALNNVAAAALNATSTQAVNGAQLFATNTQVAINTGDIVTNTTNIAANTTNIANATTNITNITNGTAGLVQQIGGAPGVGAITVGAGTGGTSLSVAGTDGIRTVTGVAAGALAAGSVDAVNGAQLFATNSIVISNTTNIADNSVSILNLTNGTAGLLQQVGGSPGNGLLTVGALTGGISVDFTGTAGVRILSGIAAGVSATDAVNLGQLNAVTANAANAVIYDTDGLGNRLDSVTLIGGTAGPVTLANVADGALDATSTDAVNGAQLFATNQQVASNTTNITTNTSNIANNSSRIVNLTNGTIGLVQQVGGAPGNGVLTVGAATGGSSVNFAGTSGARVLGGVAAGVSDTDAANVGQLNALSASAANAVQYDTDGAGNRLDSVTLAGGTSGPVTIGNVAAGAVTATSAEAVNGAQLFATNTQVATNTTNIASNTTAIANNTTAITNANTAVTNLAAGIDNGTRGLVQQAGGSPGSGAISVGAATGGTSVSIAGTDGTRVLSGLSNGVLGSDAATVAQLAAVSGGALNAVQYDTDDDGVRTNTVTLAGGSAGPVKVTNVADATLAAGSSDAVNGSQLAATNAQIAAQTIIVTQNTSNINNILTGQGGAFRSDNTANAAAPSASGANATAGGFGATASGVQTVALGNGATASGLNSVAIGAGSSDGGQSNVVSVGSTAQTRRLTNVGPALNGTDAVNLSQLQTATAQFQATAGQLQGQIDSLAFDIRDVRRRSNAGTAAALAAAGLPQAFSEGAGLIAAGIGTFEGEVAFAFGASKIIGDQTIVKAGATFSTRGSKGFNAGVGYQF